MKKNVITHDSNLLLSQNLKLSYDTKVSKVGCMNVCVIGATGEGKSWNYIKPNIWSLPTDPKTHRPHSFIFTDPKGELAEDTAGFLKKHGYKIKIFNLNEMDYSDCYNPLKYVHSDTDIMIMIDGLVKTALGEQKDPFWGDMAKNLLNSICLYLYYEVDFNEQNFATVAKYVNLCGDRNEDRNKPSSYEQILDALEKKSPLGDKHPAIQWYNKVRASKSNTFTSILSTAQGCVRLFASADVQRVTATDTVDLDRMGDEPTALYIITSVTTSTFDFLVNLMYTQLFESLMFRANTVYANDGHSLPYHVTFWLDEFANIGQIPDFDKKIATFRQANLSTVIILQTPSQLDSLYDKKAEDILGNNFVFIFLGSGGLGDKSASDWMSKALGNTTIQVEQTSVNSEQSKGGGTLLFGNQKNVNHSYSATQRPLMTPDEVRRLPGDECIIMIAHRSPIRDYKINPILSANYWEAKDCRYNISEEKKTYESYKKGFENGKLVDEDRRKIKELKEQEEIKYKEILESYKPAGGNEYSENELQEYQALNFMSLTGCKNMDDIKIYADDVDPSNMKPFSPTHEWDLPDDMEKPENVILTSGWELTDLENEKSKYGICDNDEQNMESDEFTDDCEDF